MPILRPHKMPVHLSSPPSRAGSAQASAQQSPSQRSPAASTSFQRGRPAATAGTPAPAAAPRSPGNRTSGQWLHLSPPSKGQPHRSPTVAPAAQADNSRAHPSSAHPSKTKQATSRRVRSPQKSRYDQPGTAQPAGSWMRQGGLAEWDKPRKGVRQQGDSDRTTTMLRKSKGELKEEESDQVQIELIEPDSEKGQRASSDHRWRAEVLHEHRQSIITGCPLPNAGASPAVTDSPHMTGDLLSGCQWLLTSGC